MPPNGENLLARFAEAIAGERGFSFGTPRVSDDGSTVNVPILRTRAPPRRYVLAAERAEAISAMDLGALDWVRVHNESDARVFLPLGVLFDGHGTPSRGTAVGAVLDPGATDDVIVKCVHADQPIHAGASLSLAAAMAPKEVAQALAGQDQGAVWATIARLTGVPSISSNRLSDAPGDLLKVLAGQRPDGLEMDDTQCGTVLLDGQGVVAVEVFDHPDSWQASPRPFVPARAEPEPLERLALNPAGATAIAAAFFRRVAGAPFHRVGAQSWHSSDGSTAFTCLEGEVIHLLAFGRPLVVAEPLPGALVQRTETPAAAGRGGSLATSPLRETTLVAADGDVAVASRGETDILASAEMDLPPVRPRRRKVLTSGWDLGTFGSLEKYAGKEFRGDRSAAIRFLVRNGLRGRGYLGPIPRAQPSPAIVESETTSAIAESSGAALEVQIHDYERIAQTDTYAGWLRARARSELERIAAETRDEELRYAAEAALARLPTEEPAQEELPGPEPEAPAMESAPPPPVDVRPLLRRAFFDSAAGRYPEALTLFDEILLAEPDNRTALLGRAVALRRSGKTQEALDALDAVLTKEPSNAAALLNRGRILQERGEFDAALEAFDALARVAPNDWDVWMVRGDVLARMGRDREARAAYSEALRRNPEDEELLEKIHALEKLQPAPAPTALQRTPLPREVQEGQSYLVKERRPDLSLRVVRALLVRAVPALLITSRSAEDVRRESGLAGVRTLELSHIPGEDRHDPTALAALTKVVERFLRENHARGVILLEGLAPLVRENGFREAALFLERVHEAVLPSHALFLVSVAPGDLEEREMALLERSLTVLS